MGDEHDAVRSASTRRSVCRSAGSTATSSAAIGSSSRSRAGSAARARATATRCAWPPESCAGRRRRSSPTPTSSSQRWASRRAVARGVPVLRGPNATFSSASRWGKSSGSCPSSAVRRACGGTRTPGRPGRRRSAPGRRARPGPTSGTTSPAITPSAVDLPDPLGPSSARVSPAATSTARSTSRSGRTQCIENVTARSGSAGPTRSPAPRRRPAPARARPRRRDRSRAAGRSPAAGSGCGPAGCPRR